MNTFFGKFCIMSAVLLAVQVLSFAEVQDPYATTKGNFRNYQNSQSASYDAREVKKDTVNKVYNGSVDAFDKYGRKIGMYKILPDGQIDIVDNNGNVTYSYKVRRGSKTFMYDKNGNVSGSYEFRKDGTCKFYDINEKYMGYFREELH